METQIETHDSGKQNAIVLTLSNDKLVQTNRRLHRRCQVAEHKVALSFGEMLETNRRLNRRCQELEHNLAVLHHQWDSAMRVFQNESKRAMRYADKLRDIYRNHVVVARCYGCWWCKITWRVKRLAWRLFSMKKE